MITRSQTAWLFSVVLLSSLSWTACSDSVSDCTQTSSCTYAGANEDGGSTDTGGGDSNVVVPDNCDLTKDPKDSPSCIDSGVGIFVSPTGDDAASGAKALPVKTIKRGLEIAASKGLPRVYVCEGTYDANVEITSPVSLYGGMTCSWSVSGVKPKISPANGVAIRVAKVAGTVLIADFDIAGSANASLAGDSAIGAFVSESTNVTFRTTKISAGAGTSGSSSTQKAQASNASKGSAPTSTSGGAGAKITCGDGDSIGGNGGTLGANDAVAGQPALGGGQPGAVGTDCGAGGNGTAGGPGSKGTDATPGTGRGTLTAGNWAPANGASGKAGTRGQGGGGGGSRAAAGGGGGAGGCGGEGGAGGGGGGASVALVSFGSTITLNACELSSSAAGNGGDGAPGQLGQPPGGGGAGGTGNPFDGCPGGQGGNGGNGGAGSGGAGGISAGILYSGNEPSKDASTTITPGVQGTAGKGTAANDGPSGTAAPVVKAD